MMKKRLLPIGSVVLLKKAAKRVMIIGYYPTIVDGKSEITFEYSGCLFPEGVIGSENAMFFNHSSIAKTFYYGLRDDEQENFIIRLEEFAKEEFNDAKFEEEIPEKKDISNRENDMAFNSEAAGDNQ